MRYRAKIDWWIGLILMIGLVVPMVVAISSGSTVRLIGAGIAYLVVFGLLYPQWYETTPTELVVRAGVRRIRIPYAQIHSVRTSSDGRSALALSLDRVLLEYGTTAILIAPQNQEAFFADLQARCPQLGKSGQDLVLALA